MSKAPFKINLTLKFREYYFCKLGCFNKEAQAYIPFT
jgi:hypothetical protein